ncbi:hypothetical protein ABPG74_014712 [Tetrahymena malaccensis]
MDFIRFPFKTTNQTKIKESFRKHIISKYGGEEAFQAVEKAFETINELRDKLNFDQVSINNIVECENLERTIYKYLKYAQQLQKKFKFESWQQDRVNIEFQWTDSYRQKEIITKTSNLRVEMCSILYNLAVLLYYIGIAYMSNGSSDGRKNAIKKYRYALWAIMELKRNLPSIIKDLKKPHLDFTVQNISTFENILYGLCYICLFFNLEQNENQIGIQHIASLAGEANKHFQLALKITNEVFNDQNTSFSKNFLLEQKKFLYSNTVYYFGMTALKMAKHHEKKLETEQSVPHMGIAIAYLEKARGILQLAMKNLDNISQSKRDSINKLSQTIEQMYQEFVQKNQQIYRHQIINEQQLPMTQLQQNIRIVFAMPPDLEVEQPDEAQFRNLLSPDIIQLLKEVKKIAERNKNEVCNNLKALKEFRIKSYLSNFVNGYLEMLQQSSHYQQKNGMNMNQMRMSRNLPQTIQQKLEAIQKKKGEEEILRLITVLDDNSTNAQIYINECLEKLKKEEIEDESNRNKHKQLWEIVPSTQANHSYIMKIKELQGNLREGEAIDKQSKQQYQDLQFYFNMIRLGKDYIVTLIPQAQDQQFAREFTTQIENINQLDESVRNIISQVEMETDSNKDYLAKIDIQLLLSQASQQRLNRDKTIEFICSQSTQIYITLNQIINQASLMVEEICKIAQFLNSKKMANEAQDSIKEIEKINNGLGRIMELQSDLEQGIEFYKLLFAAITDIDSEIEDYLTSRLQLKENQLYVIDVKEKNENNDGYVTDQPFFGDGGFPIGQSKYIPVNNQQQSFVNQSSEIDHTW